MTITSTLAELVADGRPDDDTLHAALRCVIDWAGCAVAGSTHPATVAVLSVVGSLGEADGCTIVGHERRTGEVPAALVNGTSSHVLDFDDVNVRMIGHPAVVVVSAVMAIAESIGASGDATLAAVATGYEIAARLGRLVNPDHYERGWHATATLGCMAAAGASARVLGLDAEATARALSIATSQAGGIRAMFGSHGKGFHAGRAASSGVLSARLAQGGLSVPADVFEGPAGYLHAASSQVPSHEEILTAIGAGDMRLQAVRDTAYKGHAACGGTHCLIDAVAGLVHEHHLVPSRIDVIDAQVHRLAVQAAGIADPNSGLEAKFSLRHTAALAAFHYPLLPESFTDLMTADPEVAALRQRVRISVDESFEYEEAMPARVLITMRDGSTFERLVEVPLGRPGNPMSDDELSNKYRELVLPVLNEEHCERSLRSLWTLRNSDAVGSAVRQLGV